MQHRPEREFFWRRAPNVVLSTSTEQRRTPPDVFARAAAEG